MLQIVSHFYALLCFSLYLLYLYLFSEIIFCAVAYVHSLQILEGERLWSSTQCHFQFPSGWFCMSTRQQFRPTRVSSNIRRKAVTVINSVPFPVSFWVILYVNTAAVSANLCVSANIRRKAVINLSLFKNIKRIVNF